MLVSALLNTPQIQNKCVGNTLLNWQQINILLVGWRCLPYCSYYSTAVDRLLDTTWPVIEVLPRSTAPSTKKTSVCPSVSLEVSFIMIIWFFFFLNVYIDKVDNQFLTSYLEILLLSEDNKKTTIQSVFTNFPLRSCHWRDEVPKHLQPRLDQDLHPVTQTQW